MDKIKTNHPIEGYCASRQGGREENQDTCGYADTPYGLLVVICDGMGGGPAGKTASVIAVETIIKYVLNYLPEKDEKEDRKVIVRSAIAAAEEAIKNKQIENKAYEGMGTTVVAVLINAYSAIVAHVGDSRCYQFRFGQKKFRTEDHSFVGDLVRKGQLTEEQARLSSQSNIITKALSGRSDGTPFISELGYEKGDRFLLCTDGIWGAMPEKDLIKRLAVGNNLALIVEKMASDVDEIGNRAGGGHDNLTLSLFKVNKDSKYKEPMNRKYRNILIGSIAVTILSLFFGVYHLCANFSKEQKIEDLENRILEGGNNKTIVDNDSLNETNKKEIFQLKENMKNLENQLNEVSNERDSLKAENTGLKKDVDVLNKQNKAESQKNINQTVIHQKEIKDLEYIASLIVDLNKCKSDEKAKEKVDKIIIKLDAVCKSLKDKSAQNQILEAKTELGKNMVIDVDYDKKIKGEQRKGQINTIIGIINDVIKKLK